MALPSNGSISMDDVAKELKMNQQLNLNNKLVRNLAGIKNGPISLNNLKGKKNKLFFSAIIKPGYKVTTSPDSTSIQFRTRFESRGIKCYIGLHESFKPNYEKGDFGEIIEMIREVDEKNFLNDNYELMCVYSLKKTRMYDEMIKGYYNYLQVESSISGNEKLEDPFEVKTNKCLLKIFIDNKLTHIEQIYDYSIESTTFIYKTKRDEILYPNNLYQVFEKNSDKELTITICLE